MRLVKVIDPEVVRQLVVYIPESGLFYWKERERKWFTSDKRCAAWNRKYAGKICTTEWRNDKGYICHRIHFLGSTYLAHRVAWVFMTGEQPPLEVDHENRDPKDNRWRNLRDGTGMNSRNRSLSSRNKTGVTGVEWVPSRKKWRARGVAMDGKRVCLGDFSEKADAVDARFSWENGEGYTHARQEGL